MFTQQLDVFTGVCFLSDGAKIIDPSIVHLPPYFGETITKSIGRKSTIVNKESPTSKLLKEKNKSKIFKN